MIKRGRNKFHPLKEKRKTGRGEGGREFNRKYNATDARSTYLVSNGNGLRVETSSTGRIAIVLRVSRVSIRGGMSANDNQQIDILVSPDNIGLPPYILSRNMWQCRVMPRPQLTLWKDNPMRSTVRVSDFAPRP